MNVDIETSLLNNLLSKQTFLAESNSNKNSVIIHQRSWCVLFMILVARRFEGGGGGIGIVGHCRTYISWKHQSCIVY
jgi:hypothetical protein